MKPKILFKYDQTDVDSRSGVIVEHRLKKLFTLHVPLKTVGDKAAARVSAKIPAVWVATFQSDKPVVTSKIGSDPQVIGEFDPGSVADAACRRQIVGKLKEEGLLDRRGRAFMPGIGKAAPEREGKPRAQASGR